MKATVFDVAKYILEKCGLITHMKLQKLCYYSQAWSLVWDEEPLFNSRIEAWANGPVVKELYNSLRGEYGVDKNSVEGDSSNLTETQKETIDAVLDHYGKRTSQWLSDLTHMESPWKDARVGLSAGERGTREISHASMAEYYEGL
ncbi:Panacea domain-containing protein [Planctomicrobium sp. SH668]|uniref:Panacea domain-containing protein n=1 Tax=Planctomicrobium sp. SH668 TaxID=3448126 RepID=UPI003F5CAD3C